MIAVQLGFAMIPAPELLDHVFAGPQGESQDRDGRGLVGAIQEDAGIAHVKIGNIMRLPEAIGDELPGIVAHAAGTGFMQAVAGGLRFACPAEELSSCGAQHVLANLF